MRINKHNDSVCETCGDDRNHVLEMFDLQIGDSVHIICDRCVNALFDKTLYATCGVNAKLKSQHDIAIINRRDASKCFKEHMSINEALSGMKVSDDDD